MHDLGRKKLYSAGRKVLSLLLCLLMLSEPLSVLAAEGIAVLTEAAELEQKINELLTAGEYREGQAIVIVQNNTSNIEEDGFLSLGSGEEDFFSDGSEVLMQVGSSCYEENRGELLSASGEQAGENLSIIIVEKEGMSTRKLLRKLMKDPRVLTAEPNYVLTDTDTGENKLLRANLTASPSDFWDEKEKSRAFIYNGYDQKDPIDLTAFEWAMNRDEGNKSFTLFNDNAVKGNSDLNLEDWNDSSVTNAGCTVVVIDDGIDYTHPDLAPVMADLTEYIEPLKALGINSGKYGYNVREKAREDDPMPTDGTHGTHIAGLIASAWNEFGTSGVANGVKLIGVRGPGDTAGELRAYNYLYQLALLDTEDELNIRIINESYGSGAGTPYSSAVALGAEQLGQEGIVIIRAAGNDCTDKGKDYSDDQAMLRSGTTLLVGASEVGGAPDLSYSDYGMNVDLFAQGTITLSTIVVDRTYSGGHYFPEFFRNYADYEETQLYFQTFKEDAFDDKGVTGVRLLNNNWEILNTAGSYTDAYVFDVKQPGETEESGALRIDLKAFAEKRSKNICSIRFAIPVGSEEIGDKRLIVEGEGESATVRIDPTDERYTEYLKLKDKLKFLGLKVGTGKISYDGLWINPYVFTEGGSAYYTGDFVITGEEGGTIPAVCTQNDGGCCTMNYDKAEEYSKVYKLPYTSPVSAEVSEDKTVVDYYAYLDIYVELKSDTRYLYVDCIGAGNKLLPYAYSSGTSMAAPVACGMAAVQYQRLCSEDGFSDLTDREQAVCLLQELKANTQQTDAFKDKGRSGLLDASVKEEKHPVISAVGIQTDEEGTEFVRIKGVYFGEDDPEKCKVTVRCDTNTQGVKREFDLRVVSWEAGERFEDGTILCERPAAMNGGLYYVTVTNPNGYGSFPAVLKFQDTALFETELRLPAEFRLQDSIDASSRDIANYAESLLMAQTEGKLYLIPQNTITSELWEYDPKKGTDENAFTRVTNPTGLMGMFNWGENENWTSIYGMAGSGGKLWIYGSGYDTKKEKETSLIVCYDPAAAKVYWYGADESYEHDNSAMIAMGGSEWLAFAKYVILNQNDANEITKKISLWAFNTADEKDVYWEPFELPEGLSIKNNTRIQYAAGADRLYIAGDFLQNGKKQTKLLEYSIGFTKKKDGSWEGNLDYIGEIYLPQFDTTELASFALTMNGNDPVVTAAHTATGDDFGHDTFLYSAKDAKYTRHNKKFSLEKVNTPTGCVLNDTLYVSGTSAYSASKGVMMMRATGLTEKKETYTVHFDNQGHGTKPESTKVKAGELVEAPKVMEEEGYLFAGWWKEASCETYWDFEKDRMPASDITLYAYWIPQEEEKYTVIFDHQGHGTQPASQQLKEGELILAPQVMTEEGYVFGGWYKESSCVTPWDFSRDRMPAKDLRLYAKWTKKETQKYTVVFDTLGHGIQPASIQLAAGTLIPAPEVMTEEGYIFGGWYQDKEFTKKWDFETDTMPEKDLRLYAKWTKREPAKYLVVFDTLGHGTQPASVELEAGKLIPEPGSMAEQGYVFGGWYKESTCVTSWNFNQDRMPAKDMTLYAKWTKYVDPKPGDNGGTSYSGDKAPQPKPAVTPIVKQADGTQTMGSSVISLPPSKLSATDKTSVVDGRWVKNAKGYWQFTDLSGKALANRWALIPDSLSSVSVGNYSWFYFDASGNMVTGWQWIRSADGKNVCYYFNEEAGSLYGACLMGGNVENWQLNEEGAWVENGNVVTK